MSTPPRSTVQPSREQLDELDALLQRMLELPVNPLEDAEPPVEKPAVKDLPAVTTVESPGGQKRPSTTPRPSRSPAPRRPKEKQPTAPPGDVPRSELPASPRGLRIPEAQLSPPIPQQQLPAVAPSKPAPVPEAPVAGPTIKILSSAPAVEPPSGRPGDTNAGVVSPVTPSGSASVFADLGAPATTVTVNTAHAADAPLSWWQWPLGWINLVFDFCASRLGAPGRWARQRPGRAILGWIGVALLGIAAILLILDWIGWPP